MGETDKDIEAMLSGMDDAWDKGGQEEPKIPPGIYRMQLLSARLQVSGNGNLMIRRGWSIIEGEYDCETVYDNCMVSTPQGPRFTRMWIEQMGSTSPGKPSELGAVVDEIVERAPVISGKVTHSESGFTNVRVEKLLEDSAAVEPSEDGDSGGEDAGEAWAEGDRVKFTGEGKELLGSIVGFQEDDGENCAKVKADGEADDEELWLVPVRELEAAPDATPAEDDLDALVAFCQAQDVAVTEKDDRDTVIAAINESDWDRAELDKDAQALLESIGADFFLSDPAPKKKAAKKKAAAPVKKSGKKKSRK